MTTNPTTAILTPDKTFDFNETIGTIYSRRAIRKYKNVPVKKEIIETILNAGRMSPSAINKQPWKFHVLSDKNTISLFSTEIAKASRKAYLAAAVKNPVETVSGLLRFPEKIKYFTGEDPIFHGAPVVIFISAPKNNEWAALDIGMCVQNMMLAAKSLGLDTCPIGLAKYVDKTESYPKLKIPSNEQVLLAVILGYGDENPKPHERKLDNVFYFNS